MKDPYLLVTREGPVAHVAGTPVCRLGQEIPRPGERPDGVFGGWSWDGHAVRADNDRYGMYPLYYFSSPERFAISPSLPTLLSLGAPNDLDREALAVFLRLGFFLSEDTPFLAIRALPPNAGLEWSNGRLSISGGLSLQPVQPLDRDAAMDAFIELFRQAMNRRARPPEDVAVPLSGGRDSRHILLEFCRAGARPRVCPTLLPFPPHHSEAAVASALARQVGVSHVMLGQPGSRVDAELRKNRITNFCADEHSWYLPLRDFLPGRGKYLYDGIAGDVLSAGLGLIPERHDLFTNGRLDQLALSLLEPTNSTITRLVSSEWSTELGRDQAVHRLVSELKRHAAAPNPLGSFHFWNRTRREIALAPYRILNQDVEVLSPYLDHDLFDLLASLPASMFRNHDFHSETIRRAYPEYRHLRFHEKSTPRQAPGQFRRFAWEVAGYTMRSSMRRGAVHLAGRQFVITQCALSGLLGDAGWFDWRVGVFAVYLMQLSNEMRPELDDAAGSNEQIRTDSQRDS